MGKGQDNNKDKKNQGKAKMKEDRRTKKDTKSSSSDSKSDVDSPAQRGRAFTRLRICSGALARRFVRAAPQRACAFAAVRGACAPFKRGAAAGAGGHFSVRLTVMLQRRGLAGRRALLCMLNMGLGAHSV